ncbi:class I SAM-dependent methyltransferase [Nocardioides lijunqiniae]|uniref:class I SAM-dependent methyltransferase n=1 Tax=Nocardioides lijunqiniae TaxID=2760832 RepID=UPI0018788182|nr:class I SAM-dependent methyltransferase [Nocardioides lijunqiniae]
MDDAAETPATHDFDKDYWERRWGGGEDGTPAVMGAHPASPYLAAETSGLPAGTALDAGCGGGAEAVWLAARGWDVTGADISAEALARAAGLAASEGVGERVRWVEADLATWEPDGRFDLVMTHYAHAAIPQLELYDRIAEWVAPGGTLLVVGHLHTHHTGHDDHHPPAEASATPSSITARLDPDRWDVVTAEERERATGAHEGHAATLHDVVVRATRRG